MLPLWSPLSNPKLGIIFLNPGEMILPELLCSVYDLPFIYFISNENPHNASFSVISLSKIKSIPERINGVLFSTFTNNLTSPLQFSLITFPLSLSMINSLSSTPFAIVT